jgi:REP element-mobilizing transposase RayT
MSKRNPQLKLLSNEPKSYGGELFKTRKGRSTPRPLDTKNTMHVVLRSSRASGDWSFKRRPNEAKIRHIFLKFSKKYSVKILSLANVGNHLHLHVKLANRFTYYSFIRATTGSIVMAITGAHRDQPLKVLPSDRFWDYRPFTRVVQSLRDFLNLRDYIRINQLEGFGIKRESARFILARAESG